MKANVGKLHDELVSAELPIHGVNSDGIVSWHDGHPTLAEAEKAQTIIDAHDPAPVPSRSAQIKRDFRTEHKGKVFDTLPVPQALAWIKAAMLDEGALDGEGVILPPEETL